MRNKLVRNPYLSPYHHVFKAIEKFVLYFLIAVLCFMSGVMFSFPLEPGWVTLVFKIGALTPTIVCFPIGMILSGKTHFDLSERLAEARLNFELRDKAPPASLTMAEETGGELTLTEDE